MADAEADTPPHHANHAFADTHNQDHASDDPSSSESHQKQHSSSESHHQSYTNQHDPDSSFGDEFTCGICFDLMVLPTSLNCGHSFCRPCLASWVVSSRRLECPSCRQRFYGPHNVNVVIRSSMERAFGQKVRERTKEVQENPALQKHMLQFDKMMRTNTQPQHGNRTYPLDAFLRHIEHFAGDAWKLVRVILAIGLGVSNIFFLAGYLFSNEMDRLVQKPFYKWAPEEVEVWLKDLGPWTETELLPSFRKYAIDGRLLLALNEEDLDSMFRFSQQMYRNAFLMYINSARDEVTKPPADLWEFKALHPLWACVLAIAMKHNPRTTFLFMFIFDYHNSFLPFIHSAVQGRRISHLNIYNIKMSEPSASQLTDFVLESVFVPFVLVMKFAWNWLSVHWLIVPSVIVVCLDQTIKETKAVIQASRNISASRVWNFVRSYFNRLCYYGIPICLWPVLPRFLYDLVFNVTILWHLWSCLAILTMSVSATVIALEPLFRR